MGSKSFLEGGSAPPCLSHPPPQFLSSWLKSLFSSGPGCPLPVLQAAGCVSGTQSDPSPAHCFRFAPFSQARGGEFWSYFSIMISSSTQALRPGNQQPSQLLTCRGPNAHGLFGAQPRSCSAGH